MRSFNRVNLNLLMSFIFLLHADVFAKTFKKVDMPDQLTIEGKNLVLNGMGLREVTKFGIPISVYVAGLYLEKKEISSEVILKKQWS